MTVTGHRHGLLCGQEKSKQAPSARKRSNRMKVSETKGGGKGCLISGPWERKELE